MHPIDCLYEAAKEEQWGDRAGYEPAGTVCYIHESPVPDCVPLHEWQKLGARTYSVSSSPAGRGWHCSRLMGMCWLHPHLALFRSCDTHHPLAG